MPVIGSFSKGEITKAAPIIPTFKKIGAAAGAAKRPSALSMPIDHATSETKIKYGNMIRVSSTVSSNFSGLDAKPAAKRKTSWGLNIMPSPVKIVVTPSTSPNVFEANFFAA